MNRNSPCYEQFLLQCLSQVRPLRNYFLREENYANVKRPPGDSSFLLVQRFGELLRKLWNPRAFKAHVSPHEMLQAVVLWSKKRFQFIKPSKLFLLRSYVKTFAVMHYKDILCTMLLTFFFCEGLCHHNDLITMYCY